MLSLMGTGVPGSLSDAHALLQRAGVVGQDDEPFELRGWGLGRGGCEGHFEDAGFRHS